MDFTLTDEDVQLMLAEIQRFCQRSIGPLVERPERLISTEQLQQLTMQAIEIGLINLEPESAAGLWENLDAQWGRKFSSTALLEVSGAMMPSGLPVPKVSGVLEAFFAWS